MSEIFFEESVILLDIESDSKEEVLELMGRNLVEKGLVKESFITAILERENQFPTGLPTAGVSVAIPHTDVEHVNKKTISIGILKKQVNFGVMGDDSETTPVQIVFMLAIDEAHSQLKLLQNLMQIFQDEKILKYIVKETNKSRIKKIIVEKLDVELKGGE